MEQRELTPAEKKLIQSLVSGIKIPKPATKTPLVIAMVGLVGAGRSSVARELAKSLGAVIISNNDLRVTFRKKLGNFDPINIRAAGRAITEAVLAKNGIVILDSDVVSADKRDELKKLSNAKGVRVIYVRVFADMDVQVARAISEKYGVGDLYTGASTALKGSTQAKATAVRLREMWRRTPLHYSWNSENGGSWILKTFNFATFADIDTTDDKKWKLQVKAIAEQLRKV